MSIFNHWIRPKELRRRGILGMNRRNVAYIGRYNSRDRFPLVDNKLKTKRVATRAGLTVPELLGVVSFQHEIEAIAERLENLTEFAIKPAQGSGGKGILVVIGRDADHFTKSSGDLITLEQIKRHLSNITSGLHSLGGRPDVAIIESLIHIDPTFKQLSFQGVPDIRVIVFKGYPVMAMLRCATRMSDGKANLHQGAIGVGLDIGTGRAIAAVQHNLPVNEHPDTGVRLDQIAIANWRQILELTARCYEVTQLGYLGCDIVLDETLGPLLLELNARPGLSIQIANDIGLLPRLRAIEALDEWPISVEDRVEFSMSHFSTHTTNGQEAFWEEATEETETN